MKGYVYIIRSNQTDVVYYGSTTQTLSRRMSDHRQGYKCWLNYNKKYTTSFEIVKYDDAYIELLETVEFQDKKELHAREGHYIRTNNCVNKVIPDRTRTQRNIDNKDLISDKNKSYYEINKDRIKEQHKQDRIVNGDKIRERDRNRLRPKKEKALENKINV